MEKRQGQTDEIHTEHGGCTPPKRRVKHNDDDTAPDGENKELAGTATDNPQETTEEAGSTVENTENIDIEHVDEAKGARNRNVASPQTTQREEKDVKTVIGMAGGVADNCNIVGQGTIFVCNHGRQGCASQESLGIRIKQLNEVFKETHTLHKAEELLERHNHVAICGAPGEGKTSTALNICKKYLHKKYEVVFVENIEVFDVDTIIQRRCDMLVVFDDIFGSVAFPSSLEKIHKVLIALVDDLVNTSFQQEQAAQKRDWKNKLDKTQTDEKPKSPHKLHFIFTSRSYNWNEGRGRMHQFKVSLFKPESVIDMTKTGLTTEEKESILNSFEKRSKKCDISNEDKNTITRLQDSMFGFPLICQLYCTNPAFQMHNIIDFFKKPVTYLRGDLDSIVRKGSSRSAALVLLVLCGGKLNLASFKGKEKSLTDLFQAVKEDVASCTRTDIGREISNFTGTYCTVENHVASFSHPSIYDAAACALGNLNEDLLLEHCSLQFLYERVRLNKADHQQITHTDDVTNMMYITSSLHPLVISRLVEGVREGCFRWTVSHPVFSCVQIATDFLTQMTADLPNVLHRKDKSSGECFLYWVSLSTNHSLFEHSVSLMCREGSISHSVLADFYESIIGCTQHGNLKHLQHIAAVLKQHGEYDVDRRTKGARTLLMIAAEAGQLGVFNFLLQEGADVSATDKDRYNCLHLSCKSGSKDIVNVIIEKFQHLINDPDRTGNTPVMVCAESGQVEILKFLVSHKADLTLENVFNMNAFQIASSNGYVSVVEYLLTCEHITIDMRGGWGHQTAVMMAAEGGQYGVYNLLVLEGADLSLTDVNNCDCLMLACVGGNVSIVKHLLSLKTLNINRRRRSQKQTAVMMAAERGQYDVYNLLVLEGADLSLTDRFNKDCLMLACKGGNVFIVKHLLSLKTFDINRRAGLWNQTAVMMAAARGQYDVYNLLVLEGADLSLTDKYNRDCLMLASEGGNVAILKHLLSLNTFDMSRGEGHRRAQITSQSTDHISEHRSYLVAQITPWGTVHTPELRSHLRSHLRAQITSQMTPQSTDHTSEHRSHLRTQITPHITPQSTDHISEHRSHLRAQITSQSTDHTSDHTSGHRSHLGAQITPRGTDHTSDHTSEHRSHLRTQITSQIKPQSTDHISDHTSEHRSHLRAQITPQSTDHTSDHTSEHRSHLRAHLKSHHRAQIISQITPQSTNHTSEHRSHLRLHLRAQITPQSTDHISGHRSHLGARITPQITPQSTDHTSDYTSEHRSHLGAQITSQSTPQSTDNTSDYTSEHRSHPRAQITPQITPQSTDHTSDYTSEHRSHLRLHLRAQITPQSTDHTSDNTSEHRSHLGAQITPQNTDYISDHTSEHRSHLRLHLRAQIISQITPQSTDHTSEHRSHLRAQITPQSTDHISDHTSEHRSHLRSHLRAQITPQITPQSTDHTSEHRSHLRSHLRAQITPQSTDHTSDHTSEHRSHLRAQITHQSTDHTSEHRSHLRSHLRAQITPQSTDHTSDYTSEHRSHLGAQITPQSTDHTSGHRSHLGAQITRRGTDHTSEHRSHLRAQITPQITPQSTDHTSGHRSHLGAQITPRGTRRTEPPITMSLCFNRMYVTE
ncbi:uncharacterized protein [Haliotis cracherodii]|uniref:uncharacterized protein n=1 Tax=Haliotis cracherodii TaxID=6455 RepID=UPI0039EA4CCA